MREIVLNEDGKAVYRDTVDETVEDLAKEIRRLDKQIRMLRRLQLQPLIDRRDELACEVVELSEFQENS